MKKINEDLKQYWDSIPIEPETATYSSLMRKWNVDKRTVRLILADLSAADFGDDYILIRSSRGGGFFKTDDIVTIEEYKREIYHRAIHTMRPLKKIRRVLGIRGQMTFEELVFEDTLNGGSDI